jgi:2'-5' RNA ligase
MTEGETGLILHIPEAEPVVGPWRSQHDSSAPLGVPAHVTIVYPWIPIELLASDDRAAVAAIVARMSPLDLTFGGFGRFPDVLWLDPRPTEPILALISTLTRRWPAYLPYGGEYGDRPTPHLTVSDTYDPSQLDHIIADIEPALPLRSRVDELSLLVRRADCWRTEQTFPFASAARETRVADIAGSADENRGQRVHRRRNRSVASLDLGLDVRQ